MHLSFIVSIYYSSQFEEKFEEINGGEVAPPANVPPSSGFTENPTTAMVPEDSRGKDIEVQQDANSMSADITSSQDFVSGIMKIVPSEVDVSFIFLFVSMSNMLCISRCLLLW